MATLLAAGVIGFGVQACGPQGCSFSDGFDAFWEAETAVLSPPQADVDGVDDLAAALRQSVRTEAARADRAEDALRRADVAAATAKGQVETLKVEINKLENERDDIEERFASLTASVEDSGAADAAEARRRATSAERALSQSRGELRRLESDQKRLRMTLEAAERERDNFEAAAKERAAQLDDLRRRLAAAAVAGEKAGSGSSKLRELEAELRAAKANLRRSGGEVERLTKALRRAEQANQDLTASLQASERQRLAAVNSAEEAARRTSTAAVVRPIEPSQREVSRTAQKPKAKQARPARKAAVKTRKTGRRVSGATVGVRSAAAFGGGRFLRAPASDARAVRRVLSVMREEMRLSRAGRKARARGAKPYLTTAGVRMVQRCLRRGSGARIAVDGAWGRRTSAALLSVSGRQGDRVAGCLRGRLRGR